MQNTCRLTKDQNTRRRYGKIFPRLLMYNKFMREILRPVHEPEWNTPNRVVLELGNCILRDFSPRGGRARESILILPPQAGHHSSIADYGPGQSLVEVGLKTGKSVFVTEWKGATDARKDETIDDFIESTDQCVSFIGPRVNLIGLCQGGWQSAIYTALFPENVNSLTLAAAPIDFKAGGGKIQYFVQTYPMLFYESLVALGCGNMPGDCLKLGFKMLNPVDRFFFDYSDLYSKLNDEEYLEKSRKFRNWYEFTQNLPGKMYLQIVKELFKENRLIEGSLRVLGRRVDLGNIQCPLILIAGEKDDITLKEQLFNIEKYVASRDVTKMIAPGGHIGVFMGAKTLREYWPRIFKKITSVTDKPRWKPVRPNQMVSPQSLLAVPLPV